MKFYREYRDENGRAFSIFFSIFSLILMAFALLAKMPWYLCFLFIAFSLVCVVSIVDLGKCTLEDGIIRFRKHLKTKTADVRDANVMLLTDYCGPLRAKGAVTYTEKNEKKQKINKVYLFLIRTDREQLVGKCADSNMTKAYFRNKGEIVFSMMYEKELFGELLSSFSGKIYVFRQLYRDRKRELSKEIDMKKFDWSEVYVLGREEPESEQEENEKIDLTEAAEVTEDTNDSAASPENGNDAASGENNDGKGV